MKKVWIVSAILIFVVPAVIFKFTPAGTVWAKKAEEVYYCPMHPSYTSDKPGDCPICNMKLVPKPKAQKKGERKILYYRHPMGQPDTSPVPKKDSMGMDYIPVYEDELAGGASQVPGRAVVRVAEGRQQQIGIKLATVEKRKLVHSIRTTGRVAYDPELFTAQQEFLSAVEGLKKAKEGPYHEPLDRAESLIEAARTRLRLLGMSENEIEELEKKAVHDRNLILPSQPFVWVYAAVYEYELPSVQIGSRVRVKVPTFPDREFMGEVRALDPVLDRGTRSIRLRARVEDPERLLKPEMYVDVYLETELGEGLAVTAEAVMLTGERAIVFVAKGEGFFEPKEVTLGARAGDFYEVKSGLAMGEQVVVSGNFLIDSESRLQAALQGMTAGEGGHTHGQ